MLNLKVIKNESMKNFVIRNIRCFNASRFRIEERVFKLKLIYNHLQFKKETDKLKDDIRRAANLNKIYN